MSIKINNDTANGSVTVKAPNVAGDYVVTTPQISCELAPRMQLMTAQNSTSGTSIDFTGIPSWAKKITVMFSGVSTSGTSSLLVQLGSGSIQVTGYLSTVGVIEGANVNTSNSTAGVVMLTNLATHVVSGNMNINNIVGNSYVASYSVKRITTGVLFGGGDVTLSGTLDRIRITTVNGTDTFDAGQINVLYEG